MGDPQESANERRHEQVEAVEEILDSVDPALEEHAYPVDSEELSAHYGSTNAELPNETESLGSVFDRLDDQEFDSPMAVKEAVLRSASDASPAPANADDGRAPESDHGGTPQEVIDDLESGEVAEATGAEAPNEAGDVGDVGADAGTATGTETDAAESGDELTPDTTEDGEFAPQESVERRDREVDRGETSGRVSGDEGGANRETERGETDSEDRWEAADEEPGDPAEPTAEPAEAELDPEERAADLPDAREADDAAAASERARYAGDDQEPLEGTSAEDLGEDPVPDASEEDGEATREGNVPDGDDDGS